MQDPPLQVMLVAESMTRVEQPDVNPQQAKDVSQSSQAHPPPLPPIRPPRNSGVAPDGNVTWNDLSTFPSTKLAPLSVNVPEATVPDVGVQLEFQVGHEALSAEVKAVLIALQPADPSDGTPENALQA